LPAIDIVLFLLRNGL